MARLVFALLVALLGVACAGTDAGDDDVPALDFSVQDVGDDTPATPDAADAASEVVPDATIAEPAPDVAPDVAANEPPGFDALAPLTVKMGHVVALDVNAAIDDAEDPDSALVLSWSSVHVALADDGTHVLVVVAPTDWFGDEVVELIVTDSAGATASAFVTVTVQEVVPPVPAAQCPKTLFSYTAPAATAEVLLSGTFNAWAGVGASELALADPDADHTWTLEVALPGGHYLYKYIVDGTWVHDPATEVIDDGYGGKNSVLDVPACPAGPERSRGEE